MKDLVSSLKKFIYRDFFFILGGITEILTILIMFGSAYGWYDNLLSIEIENNLIIIYLIGIAYVFGFLSQELFNLIGITSNHPKSKYNRFLLWLYKRITHEKKFYDEIDRKKLNRTKFQIYKDQNNENNLTRLERIITLKQIGTSIGSSFVISGLISLLSILLPTKPFCNTSCWIIPVCFFCLGILLISFGWIKLMEQTKFVIEMANIEK